MDQNEGNQSRILVIFIFARRKKEDYHQKNVPGRGWIGEKHKENMPILNCLLLSDSMMFRIVTKSFLSFVEGITAGHRITVWCPFD